jgi:hypothetical protein
MSMKHEYRFTFTRWTEKGPLESHDVAPFCQSFDAAIVWASGVCERNECRISSIEWYDEDLQRWQRSSVSYT